MGHSYKGAGCPPGNQTLWAAPTATAAGGGVVNFTVASGNPYQWGYNYRAAPTGPQTTVLGIAATARTIGGLGAGSYLTVQGFASDGTPVTQQSNQVLTA